MPLDYDLQKLAQMTKNDFTENRINSSVLCSTLNVINRLIAMGSHKKRPNLFFTFNNNQPCKKNPKKQPKLTVGLVCRKALSLTKFTLLFKVSKHTV